MKDKQKIIFVLFVIMSIVVLIGSKDMTSQVKSFELGQKVEVIGTLNHPLGKLISIEGEIVDDSYTNAKEDSGKLLIKVEKIEGEVIIGELILPLQNFSWSGIDDPEVGKKYTIIGYETGEFTGTPEDAFKYLPRVATTEHHFSTYFIICRLENK